VSLYPTKTRLALLQDVADGLVSEHYPFHRHSPPYTDVDRGPGVSPRWVKVTSRIEEMRRAGWVEIHANPGFSMRLSTRWHLTAAGREVLEANR
jgi:hypothetical protein